MATVETAVTQYIESPNKVRFAYRRFGKKGTVPLVCHIHFRGNMDFWDPLLLSTIATEREVIIFDNAGVGKSTGAVPVTFTGWAEDMISFIRALGLEKVDLLGFSMGGLAVNLVALNAPDLVRKLILAGTKASLPSAEYVPGVVWPRDEPDGKYTVAIASAVTEEEGKQALKSGLMSDSLAGQRAFEEYWSRLRTRTAEPINLTLLLDPRNQIAAIVDVDTVENPEASFDRLHELKFPVLVANGDQDLLIPSSRSWELMTQIENAQLIIYPRSGHGFLWRYAKRFGEDVNRFLDGEDFE